MADALCGPSKPLQNIRKHAATDRTLQREHFIAQPKPIEEFRTYIPSPYQGNIDAEFEAFKAPLLGIDDFHHEYLVHNSGPASYSETGQQEIPEWTSEFHQLHLNESKATPLLSSQFKHEAPLHRTAPGDWHQDHKRQRDRQPLGYMAQATNHEIDWRMLSETQLADEHMSVSYEPNLSAVARGKHPVQQIDYFDEATFESAFDAASRGLQPDSESSQHMGWKAFSEPRQQYDNVRMGQEAILNEQLQRSEDRNLEREEDTLATTAGQLLHKLKDEQNEKFQKSSFLSLMRQLRDKEVRVDGDKIIDSPQPLHPGGQFYPADGSNGYEHTMTTNGSALNESIANT